MGKLCITRWCHVRFRTVLDVLALCGLLYSSYFYERRRIEERRLHFEFGGLEVAEVSHAQPWWHAMLFDEDRVGYAKRLVGDRHKIKGASFARLNELHDVEELDLVDTSYVDDVSLARIATAHSLKVLKLRSSRITAAGVAELRQLGNLETLVLRECHAGGGFEFLSHLMNLTNLDLSGSNLLTDDVLVQIGRRSSLKSLDLTGCSYSSGSSLSPVGELTGLESLHLDLSSLAKIELTPLRHLTRLKHLTLQLPHGVAVTDLQALAHLQQLESLHVNLNDEGVKVVAKLKSLRFLRLVSEDLSHASLIPLRELPELTTLVWNTSDSYPGLGIKAISRLASLRTLDLGQAYLDDRSVVHLKGLRNLTTLTIGGEWLTHEGLQSIGRLKSLEQLTVTGVADNASAWLRLQQEMPNCKLTLEQ